MSKFSIRAFLSRKKKKKKKSILTSKKKVYNSGQIEFKIDSVDMGCQDDNYDLIINCEETFSKCNLTLQNLKNIFGKNSIFSFQINQRLNSHYLNQILIL